jgi:hypothetical protein
MEHLDEALFSPLDAGLAARLHGGAAATPATGQATRDYGIDGDGNVIFLGYDSTGDL